MSKEAQVCGFLKGEALRAGPARSRRLWDEEYVQWQGLRSWALGVDEDGSGMNQQQGLLMLALEPRLSNPA